MSGNEVTRVDNPYKDMVTERQAGGSVVVEQSRAIAEAIASMQIARANPRNEHMAVDNILNDCTLAALAEDAVYEYARGGSAISGPSIRLAETIARRWGNIEMGVKEIGRREDYSEVMAYAVDLQTGTRDVKTFQVRHWRDTKQGGYKVKDERDIYEIIANQGARRKRACILTVIPQDVTDQAVKQCEVTMKSKIEINPDYINKVLATFAQWGVTQEMIEKRIQRKMEAMTPALALQLRRIATSVRDGMSQVDAWFEVVPGTAAAADASRQPPPAQGSQADKLADELLGKKEAAPPSGAGGASAAPSGSTPAATGAVVSAADEHGEITNESLRAALKAATDQAALSKLMQDIMKLPASAEREETTRQWGMRVKALKIPAGEPATPPAKPAAAAAPKGKPHGTKKVKDELTVKMNKAATQEILDEVMNEVGLYAWDKADIDELTARYTQCTSDLAL